MSSTLDNSTYGDAKHRDEQYRYTVKWGAIGFFAGAAGIGFPIVYFASRRWPAVRRAHPSVKFSFMLSSACALGTIAADKAGISFDRSRWNDTGAAVLARNQTQEEQIWNSLTPGQKILTFVKDNKVSAVTGGYVLCSCARKLRTCTDSSSFFTWKTVGLPQSVWLRSTSEPPL